MKENFIVVMLLECIRETMVYHLSKLSSRLRNILLIQEDMFHIMD